MIWKINSPSELVINLPLNLNCNTMYAFIAKAVDEQRNAQSSKIVFNFSSLKFIEPVGVVILSNLIEYFKKLNVKTFFSGHKFVTEPISYLDDAGFFKLYLGETIKTISKPRITTMPLNLVTNQRAVGFVHGNLIPWIANNLDVDESALDTIRVSIEEIFHNIQDHSGVPIGCVFAQSFPKISRLQIAISDFGLGIPANVRKVCPELDDRDALRQACEEGFTTKSNVNNRGVGLPQLIKYVTQRNEGTVLLASGKGQLSAVLEQKSTKITPRSRSESYPGTLVRVILRTDSLAKMAQDLQPEDFSWY